jgi:hypothetical protein
MSADIAGGIPAVVSSQQKPRFLLATHEVMSAEIAGEYRQ